MNDKEMQRRLRRTLVEAACLSDDAVGFKRLLKNWASSDMWLKAALSDKQLLRGVTGDVTRMLQSVRPKPQRKRKRTITRGNAATAKGHKQERSLEVVRNIR